MLLKKLTRLIDNHRIISLFTIVGTVLTIAGLLWNSNSHPPQQPIIVSDHSKKIEAVNYTEGGDIIVNKSSLEVMFENTQKDVTDKFTIEKLELIFPQKDQNDNKNKNIVDVDKTVQETENRLKEKLRPAFPDLPEEEFQAMVDDMFHRKDELRKKLEAAKVASNAMVDVIYEGVPEQLGVNIPWNKHKIPKVSYKIKYHGKERLKDLIITFGLYDNDDVRVGSFMYFLSSLMPKTTFAKTIDVRNISENETHIEFSKIRIENFRI